MTTLIAPEPFENIQVATGGRSYAFVGGALEVADDEAEAILATLAELAPHLGIHREGEDHEPVDEPTPASTVDEPPAAGMQADASTVPAPARGTRTARRKTGPGPAEPR